MPVGRIEYCHLGPLTFEEFLDSLGEQSLLQYVRSVTVADPSDAAHERLLGLLRDYLLVGGMPEAVAAHARGDDMAACAAIHRSVVDTVRDDFAKYATDSRLMQLRRVYDFIPTAVGAKFRYVQVEPHSPSREVREAMDLLCLAGVAYRVHHTDATGVPLGAVADTRVFKALALDVGLMHTQCGLAAYSLQDMRSAALVNEGGVAEQFVGQQLLRSEPFDVHPQVWYWLREARSANAEVDYVLQHSSAVVPLEVKAGARGSLRSLHLFCSLKKCTVALRFDQNQISLQQVEQQVRNGDTHATAAYRLLSLPLYLAGQVRRFLDAHL
jgi:predicted AAA+ superfamily ATPase